MSPLICRVLDSRRRVACRRSAVVAFAALAGALACRKAPELEPQPGAPCEGHPVLAVRNETGESVDVYVWEGRNELLLGTVGSGRTELALSPDIASNVRFQGRRTRDRRWISTTSGGRWTSRRITFDLECR